MELLTLITLLIIGYSCGSYIEKSHYKSIKRREKALHRLPVCNLESDFKDKEIEACALVCGSTVISVDYFKKFLAKLLNIFGGKMVCYESLIDRARRESILRMKDKAIGYDMIINFRLETSSIGKSSKKEKNEASSIEAVAYGTAIKFKKKKTKTSESIDITSIDLCSTSNQNI